MLTVGDEANVLTPRYGQPSVFADTPMADWNILKRAITAE